MKKSIQTNKTGICDYDLDTIYRRKDPLYLVFRVWFDTLVFKRYTL